MHSVYSNIWLAVAIDIWSLFSSAPDCPVVLIEVALRRLFKPVSKFYGLIQQVCSVGSYTIILQCILFRRRRVNFKLRPPNSANGTKEAYEFSDFADK